MKVLICGDRNWTDEQAIRHVIKRLKSGDVVIEGEARGADKIARDLAMRAEISVDHYHAQWSRYGRAAGPIRNKRMLEEGRPDIVIAFHEDLERSVGTKHMVSIAVKAGVECWCWDGKRWYVHDRYGRYPSVSARPLSTL